MSHRKMNNKYLQKYLLLGIGLTAVALFLTFGLVIIMTLFAGSTDVSILAMISFMMVALIASLYAGYRHVQNAK